MSAGRRSNRIVAVAAAYVVALGALLLPLTVVAGAPLGSAICASAASATSAGGSQAPASHSSGCPCAAGCGMQCCQAAPPGPPQAAAAPVAAMAQQLTPLRFANPAARHRAKGPHYSRGPPAA